MGPLMYELGWDKKLSYVIATSVDLIDRLSLNIERINQLKTRRKKELEGIKKTGLLTKEQVGKNYSGRLSGEASWRLNRGEATSKDISHSLLRSNSSKIISIKKSYQYSCSNDVAFCDGKNLGSILECVSFSQNIFRKVEDDWNMSYLARSEGSKNGCFRLKFKCVEKIKGLKLENLVLKSYETGCIKILIATDDETFLIGVNQEDKNKILSGTSFKSKIFNLKKACNNFSLWFFSSDSSYDSAKEIQWQHAQFFRQKLDDRTAAISIKLI